MTTPVLGLVVAPPTDPSLARLLVQLRRWCSVMQADPGERVDAWMATVTTDPERLTRDVPVLVWCRDPGSPEARRWGELATWVGPSTSPHSAPGTAFTVPDPSVDASSAAYVAPLTRRQWRERLGLPPHMVVQVGVPAEATLPAALEATGLAVTAVAIARGPVAVLQSMAWGAPTVTDAQTAAQLDLDEAVCVADLVDCSAAAVELAHDDDRMAQLSWRGRRLVEQHFDIASAAYLVAQAVGLTAGPDPSHGVMNLLNQLCASPTTASSIIREITS